MFADTGIRAVRPERREDADTKQAGVQPVGDGRAQTNEGKDQEQGLDGESSERDANQPVAGEQCHHLERAA